jgi:hypothetical protein
MLGYRDLLNTRRWTVFARLQPGGLPALVEDEGTTAGREGAGGGATGGGGTGGGAGEPVEHGQGKDSQ